MKNVLFYLSRFPAFGGIETVTELIGARLLHEGYTVSVVAHIRQDKASALLEQAHYYLMPEGLTASAKNLECLKDVVEREQPDALVYQDSYAATEDLVCTIANEYHIPLFVFEHNTPLCWKQARAEAKGNFIKKIYRKLYSYPKEDRDIAQRKIKLLQACKRYVLLSATFVPELETLLDHRSYDKKKIAYINNPIAYAPLSPDKLDEKENIILTVCQLSAVKRVDMMLELWQGLQLPGWRFVIVGDGAEREHLQQLIAQHDIHDVELVGYADPTTYYEKAKLFWMTSSFEGWPMTLIESMQKGCVPIVFDAFSSVHDIIDNDRNGCVVANDDMNAFATTTQTLVHDTARLNAMAQEAIGKAARFDLSNIIEDWKTLLK